jgi:LysM repeat protein
VCRSRGGEAAERDLGRSGLVSSASWQAELRRYAVPFLVLAVATAGALAGRRALRDEAPPTESAKPAQHVQPRVGIKRAAARFYIVESGDTLGGIAGRFETSVDRLMELNPSVDPRALRVGQRVRVG